MALASTSMSTHFNPGCSGGVGDARAHWERESPFDVHGRKRGSAACCSRELGTTLIVIPSSPSPVQLRRIQTESD
jgi:hypothetical protein